MNKLEQFVVQVIVIQVQGWLDLWILEDVLTLIQQFTNPLCWIYINNINSGPSTGP